MIQHEVGTCCKGSHARCNAEQRAKTTQVLSRSSASISSTPSIVALALPTSHPLPMQTHGFSPALKGEISSQDTQATVYRLLPFQSV